MELLVEGALGGGTQMVTTTACDSDEAMEWMLATGTDAGMTAASADRRAEQDHHDKQDEHIQDRH